MRVLISAAARKDLEAIRRWIAKDNPKRALSFIRELRQHIKGLAYWPKRFPALDEADPSVRRFNYQGYCIYYQVWGGGVVVLEVHNGSRDAPDFPR